LSEEDKARYKGRNLVVIDDREERNMMAENEALGFVETMGLVAAVEAADAMVKAARVRIKTVGNADAALITVICEGDLAACAAAVDAGKAAAARVGDFVGSNLIPRPDDDTAALVGERIDTLIPRRRGSEEKAASKGRGAKA
jgi:microcompartment protein CcmL/EutN